MSGHLRKTFWKTRFKPFYKSDPIPETNDGDVKIVVGNNFDEIVLDESKDVLLEIYAPWCGHCQALEPIYNKLGKHLRGIDSLVIAKMDGVTNEHPRATVDRVYLSSHNVIAVLERERKRTYVIRKEGLPDVVVWTPWEKKSRAMSDFGDEEYKQMLCVNGAVIQKPITLKPGEEWTGRLELTAVPSSFCTEGLGSPLQ